MSEPPDSTERREPAEVIRQFEGYVSDYAEQYLWRKGWFDSIQTRCSVDADGPVPWITYPALQVLKKIAKPDFRVLEYGSGNSSRWWIKRVGQVVSVEHDANWFDQISTGCSPNHRVIHAPIHEPVSREFAHFIERGFFEAGLDPGSGPDDGRNLRAGLLSREFMAYASVLLDYPDEFFDIIVVDGMARVLTAWLASQRVSRRGFILFDNSDRAEYAGGYRCLESAGFHRIDFWGTGPINPYEWCTSIFTKSVDIF